MYDGTSSIVRANGCFSERFEVTVGVHQGSVLSLLLFAIVMEALSCKCHIGCPWKLLYADDLVIMSGNLDLKIQLQAWRTSLETWSLRINVGKTKILDSSGEAQKPTRRVCSKGVGVNSILSQTCNLWIHKRCSGVKGTLKKESMFRCKKCKGESTPADSLNFIQVHIGEDTSEAVPTFQYLGDVIGESGGCVDATSARITAAWKGFRQLLPIITNHGLLLRNWGNIFSSCIRKSLLYGYKTLPASTETICR